MKQTIIFLFLLLFVFQSQSDVTSDNIFSSKRITDVLKYGIESEVLYVIKELGNNPKPEIYTLLIDRYNDASIINTKTDLVRYFSRCENIPKEIIDLLYEEAKKEPDNLNFHSALIGFLGNKGMLREGLLLIEKLGNKNSLIQNAAAESLGNLKDAGIASYLLKRLEEADKDENKYLSNEIKSKLILCFGRLKAREAIPFLRNIVGNPIYDKFMVMYAMYSLAEIQDFDSIDIIIKNLNSEDVYIQEYAAYAISVFKDNRVVNVIRKMLRNNNEKIRIYACQGIVLNNDTISIEVLFYKFKNDSSELVRKEALKSLVYMKELGINMIKNFMKDKKFSIGDYFTLSEAVMKKPDQDNVNYLIYLFNMGSKEEKQAIINAVTYAGSNLLDPFIKVLLKSSDENIRGIAIKTIFQIKDSTLWNDVIELSKNDPSGIVKSFAKKYLELKKL